MCERHFRPEDVRWETSVFDEKTGNIYIQYSRLYCPKNMYSLSNNVQMEKDNIGLRLFGNLEVIVVFHIGSILFSIHLC